VFHLAHPTSRTEAVQDHHGEWDAHEDVPYRNDVNGGLADRKETQVSERVWMLT
jgi:hypothetical protein